MYLQVATFSLQSLSVLLFNPRFMKRFMQMALASFGVLALMLAGCNPSTPSEETTTGETGMMEDSGTSAPADMTTGGATTGETTTGATANQ